MAPSDAIPPADVGKTIGQPGRAVRFSLRAVRYAGRKTRGILRRVPGAALLGNSWRFVATHDRKLRETISRRLAGDHGRFRQEVLIFDWNMPAPDQDAGSLRMANLIEILVRLNCRVTLFPINDRPRQPYLAQLEQQGVLVVGRRGDPSPERFLQEHGRHFDLVLVSRLNTAQRCMDLVRRHCPRALVVFDTVDLHFLRENRRAEHERSEKVRAFAQTVKRSELRLVRQADLTLVVSPVEVELLRQEAPGANVRQLATIQALHDRGPPFSARRDLLFIGGFRHLPNVDAVGWLVREIFPKIRQRLPGTSLYVIGSHPTWEVRSLRAEGVRILGYVEDVEPYFRQCRLSVVPLRYGAGVKGKINLSMSYGLPVVSTTVGCEGMFLRHEVDVLVADDAGALADAVCRLYQDEPLWERLSLAGRENVKRHFSFEAAEAALRGILEMAEKRAA